MKERFELVPAKALREIAKVFTHGAEKYPEDLHDREINSSEEFGAMMRHSWKHHEGEKIDKDSDLYHIAHAVARGLIILENELTKK